MGEEETWRDGVEKNIANFINLMYVHEFKCILVYSIQAAHSHTMAANIQAGARFSFVFVFVIMHGNRFVLAGLCIVFVSSFFARSRSALFSISISSFSSLSLCIAFSLSQNISVCSIWSCFSFGECFIVVFLVENFPVL